ncbi:hypothetical protein [Sulfurimonas sp.]|uniref:hypothetical protein n=1 Tax=Sulfurimonas sp. TaxID=2022749 RepID=UPI0025D5F563|nr:hypothetical protein [Sulfurimonas sp.]MBW6488165.1 hypothetical protein [Sulfurimonas sp.]
MKTISIGLFAVILSTSLFAGELEWVDEQIEAIKPPRKGYSISGINDPFVFLEKNKPKSKDKGASSSAPRAKVATAKSASGVKKDEGVKKSGSFELSTIINSSALINGSWYKKSDVINSYTISDISKNSVTLKKGDKLLILSTVTKKQTLKFKNK